MTYRQKKSVNMLKTIFSFALFLFPARFSPPNTEIIIQFLSLNYYLWHLIHACKEIHENGRLVSLFKGSIEKDDLQDICSEKISKTKSLITRIWTLDILNFLIIIQLYVFEFTWLLVMYKQHASVLSDFI